MKNCHICQHPERTEIDKAITRGLSQRAITAQFAKNGEFTSSSVHRHKENCLAALVPQAKIDAAASALEHSTWLVGRLRAIAERCDGVSDRNFLEAADKLDRSIKTYGILRKEIVNGTQNITNVLMGWGVKDEQDARRRIDMTRVDDVSPEGMQDEALETLDFLWRKHPELRHIALRRIEGMSRAELVEVNGNGHKE